MRSVFEQIKDRLPITEVLATYITLIPSGSQFKSKCPFHSERSASFSVSPDRGLYYCFGCGAKGDIFTFVEQFEGLDKKGALKILADRAGIVLTREHTNRDSTDPLYDVLERSTVQYQAELSRHLDVLAYIKHRGIEPVTCDAFRIGYAPDEWRFVTNQTPTGDYDIAERAGLIKKTEKGYYDRFRKRVMFPLTDTTGRSIGFSGRSFPEDADTQSPKYLNSPETELFQKSKILFGFDKAKAAIRVHNFVILVEGQIDCVLAHQVGFKNTVATSGTAVSESAALDPASNLAVLARLTPNIFLAFDGDTAGQKALARAALVALTLGMNPKVVPLPFGTDPAEYIQNNGAEGWKELLKQSQHFIVYQVRTIKRNELSAHTLVHMLKERIFPYLARVQSPVELGSYIETISQELAIPQTDIAREFALFAAQPQSYLDGAVSTVEKSEPSISLYERFGGLLKRYPSEEGAIHHRALTALSFEDHVFTLPEIPDDRMDYIYSVVERDYGQLSLDERAYAMKELSEKIQEIFFNDVRMQYSQSLEHAEREHNDDTAATLMQKLQTLNLRRHVDT